MVKLSRILNTDTITAWSKLPGVRIIISESRSARLKIEECKSCTIMIHTQDNPKVTAKELNTEAKKTKHTVASKKVLLELAKMLNNKGYIKASFLDNALKVFNNIVPGLPVEYAIVAEKFIRK